MPFPATTAQAGSMQNPVYSGINRSRLICQPGQSLSSEFCPALLRSIQQFTGLGVTLVSRAVKEQEKTSTPVEIGVLLIDLENSPIDNLQ